METGSKLGWMPKVDRAQSLYGCLYEVAEVAFLRAGSHRRPRVRAGSLAPPYPPPPLPRQSHPSASLRVSTQTER